MTIQTSEGNQEQQQATAAQQSMHAKYAWQGKRISLQADSPERRRNLRPASIQDDLAGSDFGVAYLCLCLEKGQACNGLLAEGQCGRSAAGAGAYLAQPCRCASRGRRVSMREQNRQADWGCCQRIRR